MGTFNVTIEVAAGADGPFESIDALAGSRQPFSSLPAPVLGRLGVEATGRQTFVKPDGRRVERAIGWPVVRLEGDAREHPSLVVFAEEGDEAVLGDHTLTMLGLEVDPDHDELVPLTAYLPGIRVGSDS